MTMVTGLAAMQLMTEDAYAALARRGDQLTRGITQAMTDAGRVGQVSGLASLRRVHFASRPLYDYRSAYPTDTERRQMAEFYQGLVAAGVLMAPSGLMALSTSMTDIDVDDVIKGVRCALGL